LKHRLRGDKAATMSGALQNLPVFTKTAFKSVISCTLALQQRDLQWVNLLTVKKGYLIPGFEKRETQVNSAPVKISAVIFLPVHTMWSSAAGHWLPEAMLRIYILP
jgi:hypothetical protein